MNNAKYRKIRKTYLGHPAARELVDVVEKHGFRLKLINKAKRKDYGGQYVASKKTIVIVVRTRTGHFVSHQHFIKTFAHEVRHLLHDVTGLYRTYYLPDVANILVGYRAELDCEKWALNHVKRFFTDIDEDIADISYPVELVSGYQKWKAKQSEKMKRYWAAKRYFERF